MDLVKYNAGDFDNTCEPKECPAIVIAKRTETILKGRPDEREIEVADLIIFQSTGEIVERRNSVPNAKDKIYGKGTITEAGKEPRKEVHAYWE